MLAKQHNHTVVTGNTATGTEAGTKFTDQGRQFKAVSLNRDVFLDLNLHNWGYVLNTIIKY